MNARLVRHTRGELLDRRRDIVAQLQPDETAVRRHADRGSLTPAERDLLVELDGIDFLLGPRRGSG